MRRSGFKKGKSSKRSNIIKALDGLLSTYIKASSKGSTMGLVRCFTCGKTYDFERIQCGHFKSRSHLNTRWDPDNMKPQCSHCNMVLGGNLKVYAEKLGEKEVHRLNELAREVVHWDTSYLIELRDYWKKELDAIK